MILQEGSSQAPLWVNAPPAVPPRVRASGARSSQLLFEQAAGGEGLDRAADMIERQSRMLAKRRHLVPRATIRTRRHNGPRVCVGLPSSPTLTNISLMCFGVIVDVEASRAVAKQQLQPPGPCSNAPTSWNSPIYRP